LNKLWEYISDINTGKIASGVHVKNAVKRFEADYLRDDLEFREDKVQRVIEVISKLKHFTGKHKGKVFMPEPWQLFITANLYGFYFKGTNQRRFQNAYIEIARKNGKTAYFGSALGIFHLIGDDEGNAQVLIASNQKGTASFTIGFQTCVGLPLFNTHTLNRWFSISTSSSRIFPISVIRDPL